MKKEDQEILVARLQSSETADLAFSEMVKIFQRPIYFFVRRMVLDHDDANDVTQNVFIKAWKGLPKFRSESMLSSWLYRIATNESITFLNKKKKIAGVPLDSIEHSLSANLEADVFYDGDEIQRKLQTAVALLPDKQKAVFIMKYFEEKKYTEIAEITSTSVGALKASFHHAVKKIEQFLIEG
ncbi:MAG: RNA polymerase sigma-70 factor (ECF subfamily) [Flavobacteriales bacterium]